ncbi:MAG TPA: molybdopterin-dependent oxidoreductase, partial [Verrucomicrobiae bacterium]|nr:molybdopterin-dependent oxidoreductase [Verrucomicrobiae bacterium]
MVSLTIDGRSVSVPEGTTILEAAAELGIKIPTLCWLKKVSPTGACRVCLVDVEGLDRPQTACNTPVKEGISVITSTPKLESARKRMVELLLVNHPLDCPVCDAAGECDLQDSCYGLGVARQDYAAELKRKPIRYDWPLIESDPNRCILCEKCVKVDHEIVRADAIQVTCRGDETIIDTVDGKALNCDFCGNCVQACPVGALIHKPFKFRGRPWTFSVTRSVCAFCSAGCEIDYHVRNGRVERVTSEDCNFNGGNLCINGRYGYGYLNSSYRLTAPLLREAAGQVPASWDAALGAVAGRLKEIAAAAPEAVAAIGSPRITNEENALFGALFREALGSGNIDSEAAFGYAAALGALQEYLGSSSATIDRIDGAGAVLVFGCDLNAEASGIEYRVIRAATKQDARLVLANMRDVKLKKIAHTHLKYRPGSEVLLLNALVKLILEQGGEDKAAVAAAGGAEALLKGLGSVSAAGAAAQAGVSEEWLREAAAHLAGKKSVAILFGSDVIRSTSVKETVRALANLAIVTGAVGKENGGVFAVHEKGNIRGMLEAGISPATVAGRSGKGLSEIVEGIEKGSIRALYVVGSDPVSTFPDGNRIRKALEKLELLVVQDIFPTATSRLAHVVLPAAAAAEKAGTFTTIDGRTGILQKAVEPPGEAKADLEIFGDLHRRISGIVGGPAPVVRAQQPLAQARPALVPVEGAPAAAGGLRLLAGPVLYHNGTATSWSEYNREVCTEGFVEISAEDAAALGIADGAAVRLSTAAGAVTGKARVSGKVQTGLLFAPTHFP